jgi:hypothetical protein
MSDLLLITIFTIHLLAADLAMAGPLVALWLEWRGTQRGEGLPGQIGRRLAWWSIGALVVGVSLGLLAVVVLPQVEPAAYREAFGRVPASRWWYAAGEVTFSLVCMALYAGLWNRAWFARHRGWHRLLAVLAATNLMYHFPPLFTMISTLSMRPDLKGRVLDVALYRKLLLDGETLSRVVHHWLAGAAIAAVAAMLLGVGGWACGERSRSGLGIGDSNGTAQRAGIVRAAARVALGATMLQIAVGVWVLLAMPSAMQSQLLGEDWLATALFGTSIIAALGLMHFLSIVSLGGTSRSAVYRAAFVLAIVLFLMVATLHRARQDALEPRKVSEISAQPGSFFAIPALRVA